MTTHWYWSAVVYVLFSIFHSPIAHTSTIYMVHFSFFGCLKIFFYLEIFFHCLLLTFFPILFFSSLLAFVPVIFINMGLSLYANKFFFPFPAPTVYAHPYVQLNIFPQLKYRFLIALRRLYDSVP